LPFDEQELANMKEISDFDWDKYHDNANQEEDELKDSNDVDIIKCPKCGYEFQNPQLKG